VLDEVVSRPDLAQAPDTFGSETASALPGGALRRTEADPRPIPRAGPGIFLRRPELLGHPRRPPEEEAGGSPPAALLLHASYPRRLFSGVLAQHFVHPPRQGEYGCVYGRQQQSDQP